LTPFIFFNSANDQQQMAMMEFFLYNENILTIPSVIRIKQ